MRTYVEAPRRKYISSNQHPTSCSFTEPTKFSSVITMLHQLRMTVSALQANKTLAIDSSLLLVAVIIAMYTYFARVRSVGLVVRLPPHKIQRAAPRFLRLQRCACYTAWIMVGSILWLWMVFEGGNTVSSRSQVTSTNIKKRKVSPLLIVTHVIAPLTYSYHVTLRLTSNMESWLRPDLDLTNTLLITTHAFVPVFQVHPNSNRTTSMRGHVIGNTPCSCPCSR